MGNHAQHGKTMIDKKMCIKMSERMIIIIIMEAKIVVS